MSLIRFPIVILIVSHFLILSSFHPQMQKPARSHGVLGGTGIGFSTRATPTAALLDHIADLLSPACQQELFPEFGEPTSLRSAWQH